MKAIRHGDLCLVEIGGLPEGLESSVSNVMMQGSGGNDHSVKGGTIYFKEVDQFVFGYLVAGDNCTLLHPDHGKPAGIAGEMCCRTPYAEDAKVNTSMAQSLTRAVMKEIATGIKTADVPAGTYELRRQFEHGNDSMRAVID